MIKLIALLALLLAGNAQATQSVTFYHHDALGSVIAKSDSDGYLYLNEEYQPYGEKIYATEDFFGGSDDWYTGKNYSEALDLTYFGARWYDAKQGRFLSVDPAPVELTTIHSFNRYSYALDNPYKYIDPDGRETNPVSGSNFILDSQLRTNASNPTVGKFGFTRRDEFGNKKKHTGVDITAPRGSQLVAPISGKVTLVPEEFNPLGGNTIFIELERGSSTINIGMSHLESFSVKDGELVNEGDPIGRSGNTGNANRLPPSEDHVHLSVRVKGKRVDPQEHFRNNPRQE
jgi:RHS repeat-associated protein